MGEARLGTIRCTGDEASGLASHAGVLRLRAWRARQHIQRAASLLNVLPLRAPCQRGAAGKERDLSAITATHIACRFAANLTTITITPPLPTNQGGYLQQ